MTSRRTQQEMEEPAKRWEVAALEQKIDEHTHMLQTLVSQSSNQVTAKYFEERLLAVNQAFNDKLAAIDKRADDRINNFKKDMESYKLDVARNNRNVNKFIWIVIGACIMIVGTAVVISLRLK